MVNDLLLIPCLNGSPLSTSEASCHQEEVESATVHHLTIDHTWHYIIHVLSVYTKEHFSASMLILNGAENDITACVAECNIAADEVCRSRAIRVAAGLGPKCRPCTTLLAKTSKYKLPHRIIFSRVSSRKYLTFTTFTTWITGQVRGWARNVRPICAFRCV